MACVGVKCHKMDELSVLSHKDNVSAAPHGAEYLHNSPRNIRTVILHSDSKGQWFESTRAHQPLETALIYHNFGRPTKLESWRVPRRPQHTHGAGGHPQ